MTAAPSPDVLVLDSDGIGAYLAEVWPDTAHAHSTRIDELRAGFVRYRHPVGPHDLRPGGSISGPVMMGVVDSAAFTLVLGHLGDAAMAVTSHLSIEFLRRALGSAVVAETTLEKLGRTQLTMTTRLHTPEMGPQKPSAIATVVYSRALLAT